MSNSSQPQKHYRACNLCEAICGLVITHQQDSIISIKGDSNDPLSQGHICPKALALQDIYADKKRLRYPLKKTAIGWEQITWKEAFKLVGLKIRSIQNTYGKDAVGVYFGNPSVHNLGAMLFGSWLRKAIGSKNNFSATSLDQLPHQFVAQALFGHPLLLPVPDIDRTQYFLILGANPLTSNGSMMTAPGMGKRIKKIQQRGGKVVVVDPRKTETAQKATEHYFIKPQTDVYLLLALLYQIVYVHGVRPGKASSYVNGFNDLKQLVARYTPQAVASVTGIAAHTIEQIAYSFYQSDAAVCYGRIGVSTQRHGTLCQWLIHVLNIVTGRLDEPGGLMFTLPAITIARGNKRKLTPRWYSRVSKKREFLSELPTAVLHEEINTPGPGQIRAMVISAGNPVMSAPNGNGLAQAFKSLEFMVCVDPYLNETTKLDNTILPPATGLEIEHYDLVFNSLAVRNVAKYSAPLFKPAPGSRYDWQIFKSLAEHISPTPWWKKPLLGWQTPQRLLDVGLRNGPYKLSLKSLKKHKHGLDLGALQPQLPQRLLTPNKQIQLVPPIMEEALKKLPWPVNKPNKLQLINHRHLRSNNSWMQHIVRLQGGSNKAVLYIHPQDAKGWQSGDIVRITSSTGSLTLPVVITREMMPGVVSLPFGKVPVNHLTDESTMDEITGNAVFSGIDVEVTRVEKLQNISRSVC